MHTRPGFLSQLLFGLLVILTTQAAPAQSIAGSTPTSSADAAKRPRIGLVLAGGGAKGAAHVGVLKVLEELHVPIDCIAGTSMGALIGAGYASGVPSEFMRTFLTGIDWQAVVGGLGQRDLEPIEQKRQGVTYSNTLEMGIQNHKVIMPPGLVKTAGIEDLLRGFVAKARSVSDFDSLPIPYRAVATDMLTGNMVVIDKGDLATAMRASMAIPGGFAPVVTDGKILADGGLVRNIPVDIARELCADVVIVVNLVEPPVQADNLRSATQLLMRTVDVMIEANEGLQLQSLTAQDVRIDVEMGDIGTADFERVPETFALGEAAARKAAPQLARFAVPAEQYAAWRTMVTSEQQIESRLAGVTFAGLERVNPEYLQQQAVIKPGDTVTTAAISREAQRLSALQDLEAVGYSLQGDPANPTLEWLPKEKSWGPNFLKADIGIYASAESEAKFLFYLQHNRTWVNRFGAQWRNELQVGTDQRLLTSFYQPLNVSQRFFVEPIVAVDREWQDLYLDGERIAKYRFDSLGSQVDFGMNIGKYSQVRIGYAATEHKIRLDTGSPLLPEVNPMDAGIVLAAIHDSRDTPFNPTRGLAAALEYTRSDSSLGSDRDWERAELGFGYTMEFARNVAYINAAGGTDFGNTLPEDRLFVLGGPSSFPGHELGELRAGSYWTVSGSFLWRLADLMTLRGQALYGGLRLQIGEVYDRLDELAAETSGQIGSVSVYVTGRTPTGPLTLGIATTNTDSWSLWLSLGRPVGSGTILERGIFR